MCPVCPDLGVMRTVRGQGRFLGATAVPVWTWTRVRDQPRTPCPPQVCRGCLSRDGDLGALETPSRWGCVPPPRPDSGRDPISRAPAGLGGCLCAW